VWQLALEFPACNRDSGPWHLTRSACIAQERGDFTGGELPQHRRLVLGGPLDNIATLAALVALLNPGSKGGGPGEVDEALAVAVCDERFIYCLLC
jgi:hypothetical protein